MVDPHGTPARTRPGVVTLSSYLLILFAVIQVLNLILTLSTIGTVRDVLRDAYRNTSANGMERVADFAFAAAIGGSVLTLLIAIGLVVLAMLNNRGRNGARITTWVLGGVLICCTGGSLVSNAAGGFTGAGGPSTGDVPSADEIQRRLDEALPSWYGPVTTLLGVLGLLALLAALILLALPKANEFFRKPQPTWEQPLPGAGYPAHPQAPGYPPYPGAPGHPQAGYPQAGYPQAGYPQAGYPQAGYPESPGQPGYPQPPGQPGWPQGPGAPSASGQWQPPAAPESAPPAPSSYAAPGQESAEHEPGRPPSSGTEREDGPDRPGPNPPSAI